MISKKILIVDFKEERVNSLAHLLHLNGVRVVTASNGLSGLEKFESEKPDLVILEASFPEVPGFRLCKKITQEYDIKVPLILIAVDGVYPEKECREEVCRAYGAAAYFEKPYEEKEILSTIYNLLEDEVREKKIFIKTQEESKIIPAKARGTYKVILADDCLITQRVVNLAFLKEDYEIYSMASAQEVMESIEEIEPDIILLDVNLKKRDGYEIYEFIKNHPKVAHTPLIILKEAFERINKKILMKSGYDSVIQKPFNSKELVSKVKEILAKKQKF